MTAIMKQTDATALEQEQFSGELKQLRAQANYMGQLYNELPSGLIVIDGNGVVEQANRVAVSLLGEPLQGLLWRHIIDRSFAPKNDDGHEISLKNGRRIQLSISSLEGRPGQLILLTDLTDTRLLQEHVAKLQRLSSLGKMVASLAHQIRRSNVFTLVSLLEKLHIPSEKAHITDDKPILKEKIKSFLEEYDVLLFSGAVSKGKFDFLPEVFEELGVEKLFHKVAQRPGKPFWMGKKENCCVFGFPGNPISTFVNCLAYFYPWYYKSTGVQQEEEKAILAEDVTFKPNLTYFLQVQLSYRYGHLIATPIKGNGSGDLASLVNTDAFIQLPKTEEVEFKKGEVFPIIEFRL